MFQNVAHLSASSSFASMILAKSGVSSTSLKLAAVVGNELRFFDLAGNLIVNEFELMVVTRKFGRASWRE